MNFFAKWDLSSEANDLKNFQLSCLKLGIKVYWLIPAIQLKDVFVQKKLEKDSLDWKAQDQSFIPTKEE